MAHDMRLATQVITDVAGADVLPLMTYLKGKKNVSEFVIAKDLKKEINVVRNSLYRLLDSNLISFNRKKDKQKGWYIYYWTLALQNTPYVFWNLKKKKLEGMKDRLLREKNNVFFTCNNGCIRLEFETAINFNYRCPECGDLLNQQENASVIDQLIKDIDSLEAEIKKGVIILPKGIVVPKEEKTAKKTKISKPVKPIKKSHKKKR